MLLCWHTANLLWAIPTLELPFLQENTLANSTPALFNHPKSFGQEKKGHIQASMNW